jgi:hypothetical protein
MMRETLRKLLGHFLYLAYAVLISPFLFFVTLELFPSLIDHVKLYQIEYYALKSRYVADPSLVLVPRKTGDALEIEFNGDMYSPEYGVDAPRIQYTASYNEHGFRVNSSQPPFEIVVIGDSFIELGENDHDTLSERLKAVSGRSTFNLGRSWYGPYQYVELLKRYGLQLKPKFALFCFFDGNDITDFQQYHRWLHGERYYFYYDISQKNFFERYTIAISDTSSAIMREMQEWLSQPSVFNNNIHPDLGVIQLGEEKVRMRFCDIYWNKKVSTNQILSSWEWQELRSVLSEFRRLCVENGMTPIIVFIPTKIQVYGANYTSDSGRHFLQQIEDQLAFETNSVQSMIHMAQELDICLINLMPHFKRLAGEGKLLYYPFDTHWNSEGRQAAAEFIAASLK